MTIKLTDLIAPSFYDIHLDIKKKKHTHYVLAGGRGSTKSSFISIEIVLGIMQDPKANATILRKVKETLRKSVFEQFLWAIETLGVKEHWHSSYSPLELTYLKTGQKIIFKGCDNSNKVKASTFAKGYSKYIWYEEWDEFEGVQEIRKVNQTLLRGGNEFVVFYSYNPPMSKNNWCNAEVEYNRDDRLVHRSTYLDVPVEWLGKPFIAEAEALKEQNEKAYNHEYLGHITGSGGEVFLNVKFKEITREEIDNFSNVVRGADFGFAIDEFCYVQLHYDRKHKCIYIFDEIYEVGLTNANAIRQIKLLNPENHVVICDSAEPKSIHEFRQNGLKVRGAKKGKDSVEYGIKFLQDLNTIYIDDKTCPNVAREFLGYELERSVSTGEFISKFPDIDNHSIDAVRYALNEEVMRFKERMTAKDYRQRKERAESHQKEIRQYTNNPVVPKEFFEW